ncbi:hypothetical protein RC1_2774 [Rhodospirillum centenum SW]|uniref:Uncharacterized protein n=1 Tax=Rhodospirillum centenum (strain ATCC 51521 / SW) TaxID=414684 RepID=B6IV23_RHOCS|nr:hypothetical protein RC1_2774 [Rhodospirillum centenum SW]
MVPPPAAPGKSTRCRPCVRRTGGGGRDRGTSITGVVWTRVLTADGSDSRGISIEWGSSSAGLH